MTTQRYLQRRDALTTYFDRTAIEAWKAFATDRPVSRIRETVRAGRARMRALMLGQLPANLSGWRILDAGCGTGAMTIELARRGAAVHGVDLSPQSIRYARDHWPSDVSSAKVTLAAGDMLDPAPGEFDAVVAMDSLIHYAAPDALDAVVGFERLAKRRIVLTHAPATPALRAMHALGKLFPRSDRSPAIVPTASAAFRASLTGRNAAAFAGGEIAERWAVGATRVVSSGFYTSQMVVLHSALDRSA